MNNAALVYGTTDCKVSFQLPEGEYLICRDYTGSIAVHAGTMDFELRDGGNGPVITGHISYNTRGVLIKQNGMPGKATRTVYSNAVDDRLKPGGDVYEECRQIALDHFLNLRHDLRIALDKSGLHV